MINRAQCFRNFFIPSTVAAAVVISEKTNDITNNDVKKTDYYCRPSELPIYSEDDSIKLSTDDFSETPSILEQYISVVRRQFSQIYTHTIDASGAIKDSYSNVENEINAATAYLREESNIAPRSGAIALGGMTGIIFGLRGGRFKRLTYGTIGALAMASICYPKEAAEFSQLALTDSRKYVTIAYNFIFGVKKDDMELPEFSNMFSDVWNTTKEYGRSAQSLLLGDSKSESEKKEK